MTAEPRHAPLNGARPIRVLVVDGSVVVRRVLRHAFEEAGDFDVVGSAANGRLALEKIDYAQPDVVVLDLETPELDGLAVLTELRRKGSTVPVVVFSNVDRNGGMVHEALVLGAADVVVKPGGSSVLLGEEYVHHRLVPLVRGIASGRGRRHLPSERAGSHAIAPAETSRRTRPRPRGPHPIEVVVIAASTGGPDALATIVAGLPPSLPVPVLVVQHMPPLFTKALAERLDRLALLDVFEARHGQKVTPGQVYLAPGGRHLALRRTRAGVVVALEDGPKENSCRPSADVLFRAAVDVYGPNVLAVVLTGMGHDGLRGSEAVVDAGGLLLAQSTSSSVIASMPAAVSALADVVAPLDDVAAVIVDLAGSEAS